MDVRFVQSVGDKGYVNDVEVLLEEYKGREDIEHLRACL
jgi:hypothetical protein